MKQADATIAEVKAGLLMCVSGQSRRHVFLLAPFITMHVCPKLVHTDPAHLSQLHPENIQSTSNMADHFQEIIEVPAEFARDGYQFMRRCTKRQSALLINCGPVQMLFFSSPDAYTSVPFCSRHE
jgi:hypothetical protein